MSTELSPDRDAIVEKLVADGRFSDRRDALNHAVDLLGEETATVEALREGLASIEHGDGIPLNDAVQAIRRKHDIQRDA